MLLVSYPGILLSWWLLAYVLWLILVNLYFIHVLLTGFALIYLSLFLGYVPVLIVLTVPSRYIISRCRFWGFFLWPCAVLGDLVLLLDNCCREPSLIWKARFHLVFSWFQYLLLIFFWHSRGHVSRPKIISTRDWHPLTPLARRITFPTLYQIMSTKIRYAQLQRINK